MKRIIFAVILMPAVTSCLMDSNGLGERELVVSANQRVSVTSGRTVPEPIQRVWNNSTGTVETIIDSTTQKPKTAWSASYSELLAADEYSKCVAEVAGLDLPSQMYLQMEEYDSALSRTIMKMAESPCAISSKYPIEASGKMAFPPAPVEWANRRSEPSCNQDASTGSFVAAFTLPTLDAKSPVRDFVNRQPLAGFTLGGSGSTQAFANRFIYRTQVNLCFAERLNALLENSDVFAASTDEHMLLLGQAYEKSQDAMMRLGYLLRFKQRSNAGMPTSNAAGDAVGAYLRTWLDQTESSVIDRIRNDFIRAVHLTASTSTSFASYLERQAGARWTTVDGADNFGRTWGVGSARSRLMNLVFGGGALHDLWSSAAASSKPWFAKVMDQPPDPRTRVLFSIARESDALWLRFVPGSSPSALDPNSGEELYRETEVGLRVRECGNPASTSCSVTSIRAGLPPVGTDDEFELRKHFGVTLEHARGLVGQLFDAVVRQDMAVQAIAPSVGRFHWSGAQSLVAAHLDHRGATGEWIRLNPGGRLYSNSFDDWADLGRGVCSPYNPDWDRPLQCESALAHSTYEEKPSFIGVVSALAFAREVLFDESPLVSDAATVAGISTALREVSRLAGESTLIRRQSSVEMIRPKSSTTVSKLVQVDGGCLNSGLIKAMTKDANFALGTRASRAAMDAVAGVSGSYTNGSGAAGDLVRERWASGFTDAAKSLLMRNSSGSQTSYWFISQNPCTSGLGTSVPSSTIASDGWFVDLVSRIARAKDSDWTQPQFDGFGLPTQWVPPADASLMGGNSGEESYQYLLRGAKSAAEEATSAVKTAIDKLAEEARDTTALAQAEGKAKSISGMEVDSLCGKTDACKLELTNVDFEVPDVVSHCKETAPDFLPVAGQDTCRWALWQASDRLSGARIPRVVADRLKYASEDFNDADFVGSELQRNLTRIWNAGRLIQQASGQVVKLALAAGKECVASEGALDAAKSATASANAQLDQLVAADAGNNAATLQDIEGQEAEADNAINDAYSRSRTYCQLPRNVPKDKRVEECTKNGRTCVPTDFGDDKDTYVARFTRCFEARRGYFTACNNKRELVEHNSVRVSNLQSTSAMSRTFIDNVAAARNSAAAQLASAVAQDNARQEQATVQVVAHFSTIQQLVGELQAALGELNQLQLKAGQSVSRANLDVDLAQKFAASNVNSRRLYRSYDMWRARALLEGARRLAVAARRSIEARFVVELSTLKSEQAFVASPSSWVDEVYEADLNAPEVVGLSQAPKIEGAIYPNKLTDYVGNLERFVQGYTITYPTSVSLPDTEVITLGAPDIAKTGGGAERMSLAPDTAGWRFYCADLDSWIAHPGTGEYPLVHRLATACGGKPPTLAKIRFWLDPWGSLDGSWTQPRYIDRHNVRWRRLAVNLVGTGIRDCSQSSDSMACYTNPFIRFDLLHSGPSWQTNYSGEWRALDIPTAHVEAGKALTAEEWLEPISNSWNMPYVANVARGELFGRPAAGDYELVLEVTPDVQLDRIERIQLLVEQDYWVRQTGGRGVAESPFKPLLSGAAGASSTGGTSGSGGASNSGGTSQGGVTGSGGTSNSGGASGSSGTTNVTLTGSCTPIGNDARIEDFEDHDKVIGGFEQRLGRWYAFHAGTCTASPATNDSFIPIAPYPTNGSSYVGHTDGNGCDAGSWQGGGIGFTFISSVTNNVETVCANYDATKYTGVSFDVQGAGEVRIEICMSDIPTDGDCHGASIAIGNVWTNHTVRWSNLAQAGWGPSVAFNRARLRKLQFKSPTANFNFSIDNLRFTNN